MSYRTPMSSHLLFWVLAADGAEAQVYQLDKVEKTIPLSGGKNPHYDEATEQVLTPLPGLSFKAEKLSDYELGHDKAGSTFSSEPALRHAIQPRLDMKEELKRRFLHAVALKMKEAHDAKLFDLLIIVAPPRALGELREYLGPDIMDQSVELPKELVHHTPRELLDHVLPMLSGVRFRAA